MLDTAKVFEDLGASAVRLTKAPLALRVCIYGDYLGPTDRIAPVAD